MAFCVVDQHASLGVAMNVIEFRIGRFLFGAATEAQPVVVVSIDEADLFEAIEAAGPAEDDWDNDADDGVPGLSPGLVAPPSRHWLGRPDPGWTEAGRAVVMDCGCGEWECGGVLARIEVDRDVVRWSDFRGPRDGAPIAVGPFTFAREQYEAALSRLGGG